MYYNSKVIIKNPLRMNDLLKTMLRVIQVIIPIHNLSDRQKQNGL